MPLLFEFWQILFEIGCDYIIAGVEGYLLPGWVVQAAHSLL